MNKLENVIIGLQCKILPNQHCRNCKYYVLEKEDIVFCDRNSLLSDALELLKTQIIRVMTLEEVIASYSSPIWLETTKENDFAFLVSYDTDHKIVQLNHIIERAIINHHATEYNKTWRCWTSRPTDEQREATPWE